MKTLSIIIAIIVIIAAIGAVVVVSYFGFIKGGAAETNSIHITNFSISSDIMEQSHPTGMSFNVQASSAGQSEYKIFLTNTSSNITLTSGSFNGTLNLTNSPLGSSSVMVSLFPGSYNIVADIMQGNSETFRSSHLDVVPLVKITSITGPGNISDTSGPISAGYVATITGGSQPYYYNWSVTTEYTGNIQKYSETDSNQSSTFTIYFYKSGTGTQGSTATYYVSLKITDALGISYATGPPGYEVNVTGSL